MGVLKIGPSEGYGPSVHAVRKLAQEVWDVRVIAETAAGGGIGEAPLDGEQYLRSNGDWTAYVEPAPEPPSEPTSEPVLSSASLLTVQEPALLGELGLISVDFGPDTAVIDEPVSISGGDIVINEAGNYTVETELTMGRDTNSGIATLLTRTLVDAVDITGTTVTTIAHSNTVETVSQILNLDLNAGQVISMEMIRDASGANDGGLTQVLPAATGWSAVPSAKVKVKRNKNSKG